MNASMNVNAEETGEPEEETIGFDQGGHEHMPAIDVQSSWEHSEVTSQAEALYYMLRGDNVLLCGKAGSGKSWVVQVFRDIIDSADAVFESKGRKLTLAVTASTGVAASLVGGMTIHSWSGLGTDVDAPDADEYDELGSRRIIDGPKWRSAFRRIRGTDILIIDEMSMIGAYFLTNLDKVCRMAKHSSKPFGGIQVIMVGDFLQLPPVSGRGEVDKHGEPVDARLCFFSPAFKAMKPTYCYLDETHRSNDGRLDTVLNAIRSGCVPADVRRTILSRMDAKPQPGHAYTRLYTRNRNVNGFNKDRLDSLNAASAVFPSHLSGPDMKLAATLRRQGGIPERLELKPGAVVMLSSNTIDRDNGHVNGSMGTVRSVSRSGDYVTVAWNDGSESDIGYTLLKRTHKELVPKVGDDGFPTGGMTVKDVTDASVKYIPLKLAWAITVHKSQGQTLDGAIIDLSDCFQRGLGYVALSRVRSLDDIILRGSLPDDALRLDGNAYQADSIIIGKAVSGRSRLRLIIDGCKDKRAMMPMMKGQAKRDAQRWLKENPDPESIMADDASVFEWLLRRRAKRRRGKA